MKKRRILLLAICLAVMIPVINVMASGSLVSGGGSSVEAGGSIGFRVNLSAIPEEYGPYTLTVSISPAPENVSVSENVNMSMNHVNGTYTVSSADLSSVTALNFTVSVSSGLSSDTTYSVSASVTAEAGSTSGGFSFTAKAAEQQSDEPSDEPSDDPSDLPDDDTGKTEGPGGSGGQSMPSFSNSGSGFSGMSGGISMSGSFSAGSAGGGITDQTLVYKGSADNYLESLSVSGYEFTREFNKTRNTYFIHVDEIVSEFDVSAEACDSSADVSIAGNDGIEAEMSKIQINVTAENGDVRIYRIYVILDKEE